MKIRLNRAPYFCPVIDDHRGEKGAHHVFDEEWLGQILDVELISDDDHVFMTIKIPTWDSENGTPGWLHCQVVKECFDILEETMNELNEKNFKDTAEKLRNDPSPETQQKANDLRNQFNQLLGSQSPQFQEDFMKIVKEKTDGQS